MSRPLSVSSFCRSRGGLSANEREEKNASNDELYCLLVNAVSNSQGKGIAGDQNNVY